MIFLGAAQIPSRVFHSWHKGDGAWAWAGTAGPWAPWELWGC